MTPQALGKLINNERAGGDCNIAPWWAYQRMVLIDQLLPAKLP